MSTLKCLFEGRKELFQGLWIAEHGNLDWQGHPVIVFDFNGIGHSTPEELRVELETALLNTALRHQLELKNPTVSA